MSTNTSGGQHQHDHSSGSPAVVRAALLTPSALCGETGGGCGCGSDTVSLVPSVHQIAQEGSVGGAVVTRIRIMQMDCPVEENLLRTRLGNLSGVVSLEFNLMQRVLAVTHAPAIHEEILAGIRAVGFTPEPIDAERTVIESPEISAQSWWPLIIAAVVAIGSEAAHWLGQPGWASAALAVAAVLLCGANTFKKGWISVRHASFNINALMSIAVTGALLIGQWPEAAMVMVLFELAERIEALSLDRARRAVAELLELAPEEATVLQPDGQWKVVPAREVVVGAIVRVRPGERIALDGCICSGHSSVNQAPITGESMPVDKGEGDTVYAGTVNETGSFEFCVTALASSSTLARIIHAIEDAQGKKAPLQRFVDRFAEIYTPVVMCCALALAILAPLLLGGGWLTWAYRALVLLVIACPCALVISTPVTIVSAMAVAARHGILIKGGAYLEVGRRLRWLALDKTGTVTHGRPAQTDFEVLAGLDAEYVRSLAAALASRSDHPVSKALRLAAERDGVTALEVSGFEALPGRGVRGQINGRHYVLGNHRMIHESGLCSPELEARLGALENQGRSVIVLADDVFVHGLFAVADTVRPGSRTAISSLHALGIQTILLTGDNEPTARAIGNEVGIGEVRGNLLPEDKLSAIEVYLRNSEVVGMVGDGINDAPALARASIGFAMGAAGTGTAIETADVALMDDDLGKLPQFVRLARLAHTVLLQNIVLALAIKAVFLGLTLVGLGTMWMAVFADVGASLLVVANGLRLLHASSPWRS